MNILPKKSWHVRTKRNIEKVRRDEEKAAEEEKEQCRRIALAEQESRTTLLRKRSKNFTKDEIASCPSTSHIGVIVSGKDCLRADYSNTSISLNHGGHINFFHDIEDGLCREGHNAEHEAEKVAEREKLERSIGLLTYLGQSAIDMQKNVPWYLKKKSVENSSMMSLCDEKVMQSHDKDEKMKRYMDPLRQMKIYHADYHKRDQDAHEKSSGRRNLKKSNVLANNGSEVCTETSSVCQSKSRKTLLQLRAERQHREVIEKQRTSALLAGVRGKNAESTSDITDLDRERQHSYNNRYNPHFVKPTNHKRLSALGNCKQVFKM